MDADIALPTSVPSNIRLDVNTAVSVATVDGVRSAQIQLATEKGDVWGIMYGRSGLDGCAPEHSVATRVSGQPARLRITPDPDESPRKWVELIWPATLNHPYGVYGLFGWLDRRVNARCCRPAYGRRRRLLKLCWNVRTGTSADRTARRTGRSGRCSSGCCVRSSGREARREVGAHRPLVRGRPGRRRAHPLAVVGDRRRRAVDAAAARRRTLLV